MQTLSDEERLCCYFTYKNTGKVHVWNNLFVESCQILLLLVKSFGKEQPSLTIAQQPSLGGQHMLFYTEVKMDCGYLHYISEIRE